MARTEKENKIDIHLFKNVYLGSDSYEYHVYKLVKYKDKNGDDLERKDKLCHYSKLDQLISGFLDIYLKNYSNSKNFEELKNDINECKKIIDKIKEIKE